MLLAIQNIKTPVDKLTVGLTKVCNKDFSTELSGLDSFGLEFVELQRSFNLFIKNNVEMLSKLKNYSEFFAKSSQESFNSSKEIQHSAEEISSISNQISKRLKDQVSKINSSVGDIKKLKSLFELEFDQLYKTGLLARKDKVKVRSQSLVHSGC